MLREANINYPIIRKRVDGRLIRVDKKGRFGSGRQTGEVWIGSTKKGRFGWGRQTGGLGRVEKKGEVWRFGSGRLKRGGLGGVDKQEVWVGSTKKGRFGGLDRVDKKGRFGSGRVTS